MMNKEKQKTEGRKELLRCAGINGAIGFIITMLLLFVLAVLIVTGTIPADMWDEYVICSVIIGALIGGRRCAKKMESGVVTAGAAAALGYMILVLAGTVFTAKSPENGTLTMKILIAAPAGGCFGGATKLYRRTKKSKIRRKI